MPKRACPFPETFSSQYKIHIGQQELSNYGVFGSKYRQEIHEKTKNLLFNGAKAVMGKIWTGEEKCTDPRPTGPAQTSAGSQALLRGQTQIGHDGRLTRASAAQGLLGAAVAPTGCCVCHRSQGSRTSCSQCDRQACSSCTRQCSSCSSLCCSVCTIIDYSGRYDEVLCCGCST
ncbi:apoptosis regulatory protein Siva isoform X1 [Stegastes partitus]|uniref:Apoptosis regulatory protein Siva n=1 Tax=Stegastes partitus TaxID=144197 RepID=A0A3B5AZ99_9TELE|nr:PREDICTED: apoptosis regulatory protein Siva isoform X1 [Stegastes partitus]